MKFQTIFTLALALTLTVPVAAKNNKKTAKKAKTEKAALVKEAKLASIDDFSYAMGIAQTRGLKSYLKNNLNVDTINNIGDFVRGLKEMETKFKDEPMKAYAAGLMIGQQVYGQMVKGINKQITGKDTTFLNESLFNKGFLDAIQGNTTKITTDSAGALVQTQMEAYHNQQMETQYGQNRKDGQDFLAQNGKLKDVKTLPSGVQYKVIKAGTGAKPTAAATVKVNYEGRLIDGTVFDTNKGKDPFQFSVSHVIKGWQDALLNMPVGSHWEIYVPQELAYGARETGKIKPFSALIFDVELLEIVPEKAPAAQAKTPAAPAQQVK